MDAVVACYHYIDRKGLEPNVVPGLLTKRGGLVGIHLNADDLLAYIAAVVAHSNYTCRFRDKLKTPGIRVPISRDVAAAAGLRTIFVRRGPWGYITYERGSADLEIDALTELAAALKTLADD